MGICWISHKSLTGNIVSCCIAGSVSLFTTIIYSSHYSWCHLLWNEIFLNAWSYWEDSKNLFLYIWASLPKWPQYQSRAKFCYQQTRFYYNLHLTGHQWLCISYSYTNLLLGPNYTKIIPKQSYGKITTDPILFQKICSTPTWPTQKIYFSDPFLELCGPKLI